ncbi:YdbC family protein [Listeria ivanovii subsp. ivanovii]
MVIIESERVGVILANIEYEIIEEVGVLSENARGWRKELNRVSWNGRPAKYDIRDWAEDHEKMGKGITLTDEEAEVLKKLL